MDVQIRGIHVGEWVSWRMLVRQSESPDAAGGRQARSRPLQAAQGKDNHTEVM